MLDGNDMDQLYSSLEGKTINGINNQSGIYVVSLQRVEVDILYAYQEDIYLTIRCSGVYIYLTTFYSDLSRIENVKEILLGPT